LIHPQHQWNFVERELVTASFVGGRASFLYFFCEEPRPKGQMKFERLPDIPAIALPIIATAGDGIAYGVAYCSLTRIF
jgi:hypothetical protein